MSSAAKQTANRENAQHSTGPRTPEGKAAVSQNANRHNLTGRLQIREDEKDAFHEFETQHKNQLQPAGALEITIFEQMIAAAWNLRRIEAMEADTFAQGPLANEIIARQLDRLARYRGQHERAFYRALRELKALQTARETLDRQTNHDKRDFAPLADLGRVKRVGFVLPRPNPLVLRWLQGAPEAETRAT
jgi:hypothetical protein